MQDYHLPFEYITVQDVRQAVNHHGQTLSLMDACGFFLCQRGSVEVSIDDKTFNIHQGDVYFYMPSTFVYVLKYSDDVEGIAVRCDLDFVLPLVEQSFDGGNVLAMREEPCISLTPEQQQRLEQLTNLLQQRLRPPLGKRPAGSGELLQRLVFSLARSLFHELLYDYACNQSLHPESRDGRDRIFQTFLASLFKNYKREREVAFYAAEQCLSPRYFSSVIKEKSGQSALQWIVQMVVSSMRQSLTTTDLSIKEIASDFNFPSQSFFGKYFKQYVGLSPKEYRNKVRGKE